MNGCVLVSIEIDAATVRRGDQLTIDGQAFTIRDMTALARGAKRLEFTTGDTLTLRPGTVLWAARQVSPRYGRRA
ncbi:hypothetical protein [Streptomyces litchfieldiae]|uniref:Uncharacterized protein n=1 Tax=Streptomyces litchfieldiae TaxID=3075543 RepID=A0ABU2N169_9ACTN|nr:hypothetical protein [Streptomyces sp. DSM 44938]MDT0347645.1 hypothetical protein [Streptomyces sp. DSM 44938]